MIAALSKGVNFKSGKWQARLAVNGKRIYLGRFLSKAEAQEAYDRALVEYGGQRVRRERPCSDPAERFFAKTVPQPNGCVLWSGAKDKHGYGKFQLNGGGKQQHVRAHRYAFFIARGMWPSDQALHSCDNPACVNPDHLRDGSQSENLIDCAIRGRRGSLRLTPESVRIIRSRHTAGERTSEIAASLGIPYPTIAGVVHFRNWKHV